MDRRDFLKWSAVTGAVALTVKPEDAEARPKKPLDIAPRNPGDRPTLLPGSPRDVLVIGAGLAGLSAALELAERGYNVTIREASDVVGGRLATRKLQTGAGEFNVEHGLHMWFHNYHNFKNIRERLGIDEAFDPYNEIHFVYRDYEPEELKSEPPTYPLNLIRLLQRSPNMNLFSSFRQFGMLRDIVWYNHKTVYDKLDDETFESWAKTRVSKTFYDVIMQPAASVTLNDPATVSAAEMVHMMHLYFLSNPKAMNREVTRTDHGTAIIDPWVRNLERFGVSFELSSPVPGLVFKDGSATQVVGEEAEYDWVVMATSVPGARAILGGSETRDGVSDRCLDELRDRINQMKVAPPYKVARYWFDGATDDKHPTIIETPQHPPINLITQFHQLEEESAAWADRTGGSILEFHLYANDELANMEDDEVWPYIKDTAYELMPELRGQRVVGQTVGSYHDFTSYEVGQGSARPGSGFPLEVGANNLSLAGDWIKTEYPAALMEKSVSTGREAANHCLLADSVRQAPLKVTHHFGPGLL